MEKIPTAEEFLDSKGYAKSNYLIRRRVYNGKSSNVMQGEPKPKITNNQIKITKVL